MGRGGRRRGGQGLWRKVPGGDGSRVLLGPAGNRNVTPRLIMESRVAMTGNPGSASYAVVVSDAESGEVIEEVSAAFGESTINAAEYRGMIAGLRAGTRFCPGEPVEVRLVSEVVIFQMTGRRKTIDPHLRWLRDEAMQIITKAEFPDVVFTKTSEDDTTRVYELAREALGVDLHDARASAGQDQRAAAAARVAPAHRQTTRAATRRTDPRRLGAPRAAELLNELTA
ncbi:MAG TPA: reverse transcriptase-like protein [Trebonia sp.]|jgi:ribonuclease HI|nr:reverse transcriptase-like protein [Trebonia sp.]